MLAHETLAGEKPVRGREYFDASCLALILDVADSWLRAAGKRAEALCVRHPEAAPGYARMTDSRLARQAVPPRGRSSWRPVLHSRLDDSDKVAQRLTYFWLVRSGHGVELT